MSSGDAAFGNISSIRNTNDNNDAPLEKQNHDPMTEEINLNHNTGEVLGEINVNEPKKKEEKESDT